MPPAIDRTAVPAWEGTDGPLCSLMNHTPVMGDVHKHESKGKYIKSAEVYCEGVPGWDAAIMNLVQPHSAVF